MAVLLVVVITLIVNLLSLWSDQLIRVLSVQNVILKRFLNVNRVKGKYFILVPAILNATTRYGMSQLTRHVQNVRGQY